MLDQNDPLRDLLKDEDYCNEELLRCRGVMCNKNTSEDSWKEMHKVVGLIYLYCPDNIKSIAHAHLLEITMREPYMRKLWD